MKIKITKPDGTIIEAEGTAEECAALADRDKPAGPLAPFKLTPDPRPWPDPNFDGGLRPVWVAPRPHIDGPIWIAPEYYTVRPEVYCGSATSTLAEWWGEHT